VKRLFTGVSQITSSYFGHCDMQSKKAINKLTPKAWWLLVPVLVFFGVFYVYPILSLLSLSLFDPSFTLRHFADFFRNPAYWKVLLNTVSISATVTLVCLILAYPVSYFLANIKPKVANLLMVAIVLPFFTSLVVRTFSWIVLLGREGIINQILIGTGIISEPVKLLFNRFAVHVGMVHILIPYAILIIYNVMKGISKDYLRAAQILGANGIQTFIMVFLPLSLPGVTGSGVLIFIFSLGFFVTPALLGGLGDTMISQFIEVQVHETVNWGFAAALSAMLLVATLGIFLISYRFLRLNKIWVGSIDQELVTPVFKEEGVSRKTNIMKVISINAFTVFSLAKRIMFSLFPSQLVTRAVNVYHRICSLMIARSSKFARIDFGNIMLSSFTGLMILYLVFPILINFPVSFSSSKYFKFPPSGFSFEWYKDYFLNSEWINATFLSLKVAVLAAGFSTIMGLAASFGLVRQRIRGKQYLYAFILSPLIVPVIITAVGCYFFLAHLGLAGTTIGLALSHSLVVIPLTIVIISSTLVGFDLRLEQAALSMGASRARTFLSVTFPTIRSGIIIASLFAFLYSFDEVIIALFLSGVRGVTLPVMIWKIIRENISPTISAVSSILVFITITLLVLVGLFKKRSERYTTTRK